MPPPPKKSERPVQQSLLEVPRDWEEHWGEDMPEYKTADVTPQATLNVQFRSDSDKMDFLERIEYPRGWGKSVWWPKMEYWNQSDRNAEPREVPPGRYPVYVISKGRSDTLITVRALNQLLLRHFLVVEPQEREVYRKRLNELCIETSELICTDFSNLGLGSIPVRNFVWNHAMSADSGRHWVLDDNMSGFYRLNRNSKTKILDSNPFAPIEDFADKYSNVALAGPNYEFFADRRTVQPPFRLNTRVYSCILIMNDLPYRWRGRYNEDTDLSLRALKDGWCTVLFNAILVKKLQTMTVKGGNTDELYAGDGRLKMAQSLVAQHPDVTTIVHKWGRAQHHVNYEPFKKNKLKLIHGA